MNNLVQEIISITETYLDREVQLWDTPESPHNGLEKGEGEALNKKMYRKIVGKNMYISNKTLIEGSNAAREFSKIFSTP